MKQSIKQEFERALAETGVDLQAAPGEIADFALERAAQLTLAAEANEPGLAEAVQAAQHRVWMFAAGRAVRSADAGDARAWGLIRGLLFGLAGA